MILDSAMDFGMRCRTHKQQKKKKTDKSSFITIKNLRTREYVMKSEKVYIMGENICMLYI